MKRPLRVVVSGGAGMIGSHIACHFASRGHSVVVLDNLSRSRRLPYSVRQKRPVWDFLRRRPNVTCLLGDIRRPGDIARALSRGADLVVHAAGQVGVRESVAHPRLDCEINVLGTMNLLEGVRRRAPAATVIFCSTNKVYGGNVNRVSLRVRPGRYTWGRPSGIPERWPIDGGGHTPYGVSKLAADLYVQEYASSYGLRTAVFRMSCIYGERQFGMSDQGWVAWMALAVLKGWPITVYGTGKQVRDLLYAGDLARLCERYHQSSCGAQVFNVGGGSRQTASILEILALLERLTGRKPKIRFEAERLHDQRIYISDIRHTRRLLGWAPQVGIQEGLGRLTSWLKKNQALFGSR